MIEVNNITKTILTTVIILIILKNSHKKWIKKGNNANKLISHNINLYDLKI